MSEETNWCPAAKAKRLVSFGDAMKAFKAAREPDGTPLVIEKCGVCNFWHLVPGRRLSATADAPVLDTRSAGAFVATKILWAGSETGKRSLSKRKV